MSNFKPSPIKYLISNPRNLQELVSRDLFLSLIRPLFIGKIASIKFSLELNNKSSEPINSFLISNVSLEKGFIYIKGKDTYWCRLDFIKGIK